MHMGLPAARDPGRTSQVQSMFPVILVPLVVLAALAATSTAAAEPVSFRNDVMAVLSRGGCNQGTCHGSLNGKGGFKLSLRGEDPAADLLTLTRDTFGRRTNPLHPVESLVLLKATAATPHEGGKRFGNGSPEYALLARWIAEGARPDPADAPTLQALEVAPRTRVLFFPADRVQLQVRATFSNGSVRDVTRLACYEPSNQVAGVSPAGEVEKRAEGETTILVRYLDRQATVQLAFLPDRANFTWRDVPEVNYIDRHIHAKLKQLHMAPSELCSDSVFLRRVYLDTIGVLPSVDETRAFLDDRRPDRRARVIDHLLERPEFADIWALKWSDLLRNEEKTLDRKGMEAFHQWIRQSILQGKPLNEFAREVLAARGSTYSHPPANFYRALRDPASRAEAAAQVFLGLRMQCARCHNHPFDRWTQDDYYSTAAFFSRVEYHIVENQRRDRFDKHEFVGEQVVWPARTGDITHPRSGATVPPRFLGAPPGAAVTDADRLHAFADWVARPDNPFFARAQANRIWYHLMGRGLVDPIDDFRASNPPVNGPLLDALAADLVRSGFNLRHLVRTILLSRTYQLSAVPNDTNRDDDTNFSRALVRPLQAEQLLDALVSVTEAPVKFNDLPLGTRAGQLAGLRQYGRRDGGPSAGELFLRRFGKPERLMTCECERSEATTLGQAFQLITGDLVNRLLSEPDNRIGRLQKAGKSDREILEELYLAALCRYPSAVELEGALRYVAQGTDSRAALEDVAWGLVNAKEFLLRQ